MTAPPAVLGQIAAALVWPKPKPDGTTVIPADTLRQVQVVISGLVNYIDTQLARCKMAPDAPKAEATTSVLVR
jgi:hypothetical protein